MDKSNIEFSPTLQKFFKEVISKYMHDGASIFVTRLEGGGVITEHNDIMGR